MKDTPEFADPDGLLYDQSRKQDMISMIEKIRADRSGNHDRPSNIRLTDGFDRYAPKTAEQVAFTALVLSGRILARQERTEVWIGPSVTEWFNSLNNS